MVLEFLLPFKHLNRSSLLEDKKKEVMKKAEITIIKAVILFEYEKANKGYWDKLKLHQQVVNKALPIAKAFNPDYSLLILFHNAINHSVYAKDALRITQINKRVGDKQIWFCNEWFK